MPRRRFRRRNTRTYILVHEPLAEHNGDEPVISDRGDHRRVLVLQEVHRRGVREEADAASGALEQPGPRHVYARRLGADEEALFAAAETAYQLERHTLNSDEHLPDDGYDYEQHYRERGDGVFVPAQGLNTITIGYDSLDGREETRTLSEARLDKDLEQVLKALASDDEDSETAPMTSGEIPLSISESSSGDELEDDFVLQANRERPHSELHHEQHQTRGANMHQERGTKQRETRTRRFIDERFDALFQSTYATDVLDHGNGFCDSLEEHTDDPREDVFQSLLEDFEQDLRKLRLDPTRDTQGVRLPRTDTKSANPDEGCNEVQITNNTTERCAENSHCESHADESTRSNQPSHIFKTRRVVTAPSRGSANSSPEHEIADQDWDSSIPSDSLDASDDLASEENENAAASASDPTQGTRTTTAALHRPRIIHCPRGRFAHRRRLRSNTLSLDEQSTGWLEQPTPALPSFSGGIEDRLPKVDATNSLRSSHAVCTATKETMPGTFPPLCHSTATTDESASIGKRFHKRAVKIFRRQRRAAKKALREAYSRERVRQTIHRHSLGAAKVSVHYNDAF